MSPSPGAESPTAPSPCQGRPGRVGSAGWHLVPVGEPGRSREPVVHASLIERVLQIPRPVAPVGAVRLLVEEEPVDRQDRRDAERADRERSAPRDGPPYHYRGLSF